MSLDAFDDLETFESLTKKGRAALAVELKEALGADWKVDDEQTPKAAVSLVHKPTKLPFVAVPGGTFEMGLTKADLVGLKKVTRWSDAFIKRIAGNMKYLTPARKVKVVPFITMRTTLTHKEVERLSKKKWSGIFCYKLEREEARELVELVHFRLPTDAEHEWLARDGRQLPFTLDVGPKMKSIMGDSKKLLSRFGVTQLFEYQWMEDDHHASYKGAPPDSRAWKKKGAQGTTRGGTHPEFVVDNEELPGLLACCRPEQAARRACIRLTLSLPSS